MLLFVNYVGILTLLLRTLILLGLLSLILLLVLLVFCVHTWNTPFPLFISYLWKLYTKFNLTVVRPKVSTVNEIHALPIAARQRRGLFPGLAGNGHNP